MMLRPGNFFISGILFIFLSLFLLSLLHVGITKLYKISYNSTATVVAAGNFVTFLNLINRDIKQADSEIESWSCNPKSINFYIHGKKINWSFKNNSVYRKEELSRKSIILQDIEKCEFDLQKSKDHRHVVSVQVKTIFLKKETVCLFNLVNGIYE